jgi:hypothetical protein
MASSDLSLDSITFQDFLRSKPVRNNFTDIENEFNALRAEFQAAVPSTAAEVVNARDNMDDLQDNIHLRKVYQGFWNTGGVVSPNGAGNNTVRVTAGSAIVNGVGVDWTSATSGTVSVPTTHRNDVVAINSNGTLTVESGGDGATAPMPDLSATQRPLYHLWLPTETPLTINTNNVFDIRTQGAYVKGQYFFKIQDAIDFASTGAEIIIEAGRYYEELDLAGKNNIHLNFKRGSTLYRPGGSSYAIKNINTAGNETVGTKITGASIKGNSKGGAFELLKFRYADDFTINDCVFDANASSTASKKAFVLEQCDGWKINNNWLSSTYSAYSTFQTCTDYTEDGYRGGQGTILFDAAELANYQLNGWSVVTAAADRAFRGNSTTVGTTGGNNSPTVIKQYVANTSLNVEAITDISTTENAYYTVIPLKHR